MPVDSANHPEKEQLVAFGLGKLDPDQAEIIARHIESCHDCSDTVVNLQDDTFVSLVRNAPAPPTGGDSIALEKTFDTTSGVPDDANLAELPVELRDHSRYEVLELIGRGGMGDVYKAQHKVMNRVVALKVIKPQLVRNDAAVERFRREVQAAARLRHGNIVTAHDAEQAGGSHFLVMEYVDGDNLDEVIRQRGRLSIKDACNYIRQAAEGLQHAHDLGMVHRDIKPHNLMIERQTGTIVGNAVAVKILDFGLANFANEVVAEDLNCASDASEPAKAAAKSVVPAANGIQQLTQKGAMMGTPDYIAPEQAENAHAADIRSDIYSLGCTLYTLLTGRAPFSEASVIDKVKAHAEKDAPPLCEYRDDVPPEVEAVLRKMMAKNSAERYQTPAAVVAALSSVERLSRVLPPKPQKMNDSGKSFYGSRRPLVVAATAALLAALVVAAVVFYMQTNIGVVRIEVTDPSLQVTINGQTISMQDSDKRLEIRVGRQNLIIRQHNSDFKFETESFQVRRNDKIAFRVDLRPGEVVVSKNGQPFGAKTHAPKDLPPDSKQIESERSRFFQAVARQDAGETVFRRIAGFNNVPDCEVRFVGEFGSGSLHPQPYWDHAARIRLTATRELAARYLAGLKGACQAMAHEHSVRLRNASSGESEGHMSGFGIGYSQGNAEGEISGVLEGPRKIGGSGKSSWDIVLTIRECPSASPADMRAEANYPILRHSYDGHLFGSNGTLAISPDGKLLATCGNDVRIWSVADGTLHNTTNLPKATCAVFLKRDPRIIAIGTTYVGLADKTSLGKVFLWNFALDAFDRELPIESGEVHSLALSPDGRKLAIGAHINETGQALLWDLETNETQVLVDDEPVGHVAFTPDGKYVVSATVNPRGTLRLFDAAGKQVSQHENVLSINKFIRALGVSPDSQRLAIAGGNWREKDGRFLLLDLPGLTIADRAVRGDTEARSIVFSGDGRLLATGGGSGKGEVLLLDAETLEERARFIAYGPRPNLLRQIVSDIAFSSDGRSLFTAADRDSAKLWMLPESMWPSDDKDNDADQPQPSE